MINIIVEFLSYEWDNYQGGSGIIVEMEKIIQVNEHTPLIDIKTIAVKYLNDLNYKDSWTSKTFSGYGLLNIRII
jgi:hypothetical protein